MQQKSSPAYKQLTSYGGSNINQLSHKLTRGYIAQETVEARSGILRMVIGTDGSFLKNIEANC